MKEGGREGGRGERERERTSYLVERPYLRDSARYKDRNVETTLQIGHKSGVHQRREHENIGSGYIT